MIQSEFLDSYAADKITRSNVLSTMLIVLEQNLNRDTL
jgi:hypothetical protein